MTMHLGWLRRTLGKRYEPTRSQIPVETKCSTVLTHVLFSSDATAELKSRGLDFLPFSDLERAVKDDVEYLRETKLIPDSVIISGWIYEVETGRTRRVV